MDTTVVWIAYGVFAVVVLGSVGVWNYLDNMTSPFNPKSLYSEVEKRRAVSSN